MIEEVGGLHQWIMGGEGNGGFIAVRFEEQQFHKTCINTTFLHKPIGAAKP